MLRLLLSFVKGTSLVQGSGWLVQYNPYVSGVVASSGRVEENKIWLFSQVYVKRNFLLSVQNLSLLC